MTRENMRILRPALAVAVAIVALGVACCGNGAGPGAGAGGATFVVDFSTAGGSDVASQQVAHGGHAARPATEPTRGDDIFLGWYHAGQPFHFEGRAVTAAITIQARWFVEGEDGFLVRF